MLAVRILERHALDRCAANQPWPTPTRMERACRRCGPRDQHYPRRRFRYLHVRPSRCCRTPSSGTRNRQLQITLGAREGAERGARRARHGCLASDTEGLSAWIAFASPLVTRATYVGLRLISRQNAVAL